MPIPIRTRHLNADKAVVSVGIYFFIFSPPFADSDYEETLSYLIRHYKPELALVSEP